MKLFIYSLFSLLTLQDLASTPIPGAKDYKIEKELASALHKFLLNEGDYFDATIKERIQKIHCMRKLNHFKKNKFRWLEVCSISTDKYQHLSDEEDQPEDRERSKHLFEILKLVKGSKVYENNNFLTYEIRNLNCNKEGKTVRFCEYKPARKP